jgi:hypothetical protein
MSADFHEKTTFRKMSHGSGDGNGLLRLIYCSTFNLSAFSRSAPLPPVGHFGVEWDMFSRSESGQSLLSRKIQAHIGDRSAASGRKKMQPRRRRDTEQDAEKTALDSSASFSAPPRLSGCI